MSRADYSLQVHCTTVPETCGSTPDPDMPMFILIGANSRSARAICTRVPDARLFGIGRGGAVDAVTDDYTRVPPGVPFAGAVVINCVGSDMGDAAALDRINRAVPLTWAAEARKGGACQFIQLSSFSVYAPTNLVDASSVVDPATDYGRSKRAAEEALQSMAGEGFTVSLLRVPILVSTSRQGGRDKLAALLRMIRVARAVPAAQPPVSRAMLTYDGLGAAVAHLADHRIPGVSAAADPLPFSYELVAACAAEAGRTFARVPVPRLMQAILSAAAPGIATRLFASMDLAASVNVLAGRSDLADLRAAIMSHFAR